MKNNVLKIIGGFVILTLLVNINIVLASSSLSDINAQIKQKEKELNTIKTEKGSAQDQVNSLNTQISEYQQAINDLSAQINDLTTQIEEQQVQLEEKEKAYNEQEGLLNDRLVAQYEAGDTSYLDVILGSESFTDLISNYYLITEVASYDTELLEKIQNEKKEIEETKATLETNKNDLNTAKSTQESAKTLLSSAKNEKSKYVSELSEEEKNTQAELDQFEKDKAAIQAELAELARQQREQANSGGSSSSGGGSNSNTTPSASGFVFPVAGLGLGNINNKNFPSYAGHTGVDVNINVSGKTIVAAQSGTVQRSTAYIRNGSYYSYGECIVIDHGNGLATLYAHGSPGSRQVSKGQTVSRGQAIMTVGTTGNSSGEHLHFEVLKNGVPVNPIPYLQ